MFAAVSYSMTASKEGDVLRVQVTGQRTRQALEAVSEAIIEACAEAGTRKVLVDVREFRGSLSLSDDYQVPAKEFPKLPHPGLLVAATVVDDPVNHKRFAFFEDVARAQGYNFRIFGDFASAVTWLDAQNEQRH
jgi:hypothetical protein